jgi:hypothetical protein
MVVGKRKPSPNSNPRQATADIKTRCACAQKYPAKQPSAKPPARRCSTKKKRNEASQVVSSVFTRRVTAAGAASFARCTLMPSAHQMFLRKI